MQFHIIDTEAIYRRLLDAPNAAVRETIFRDELVAPFSGMVQAFGGGDGLAMFKQWGMSPDLFGENNREQFRQLIDMLAQHKAWAQAAQALDDGRGAFLPYADRIPLNTIVFALVAADMSGGLMQHRYSGFGGIPGYILTAYGDANAYTLPRIQAATVHELHHNIRFTLFPFNWMTTTVAEYIIAEGLAESFAAELYGLDVVGFFVTEFDESRLDETRQKIGAALDVSGFDTIRGYIFGDTLAEQMGFEKAGVPDYAGYAIGYRIVQAYCQRTGQTVMDATFLPAPDIIAQSGYFD